MKLHFGCGDVFLDPADGWVNVDLRVYGYSFLALERPDLVEANRTTMLRYYKHGYSMTGPLLDRLCVVDRFMDASAPDLPDESVETIVAVQLIEHFTHSEAKRALRAWLRILRPGGDLLVDTIDLPNLCLRCATAPPEEREYWFRMIFGSWKNEYASHKDGYDDEKLTGMLAEAGFTRIRNVGNILGHPYPSLTYRAERPAC